MHDVERQNEEMFELAMVASKAIREILNKLNIQQAENMERVRDLEE